MKGVASHRLLLVDEPSLGFAALPWCVRECSLHLKRNSMEALGRNRIIKLLCRHFVSERKPFLRISSFLNNLRNDKFFQRGPPYTTLPYLLRWEPYFTVV